jgi:hypothetical protein
MGSIPPSRLPPSRLHGWAASLSKGRGEQSFRWVAIGVALAVALAAAHARMFFVVLFCWIWALQNARALSRSARNVDAIMRVHLQAAFDAAERGDASIAIGHCRTILAGSRTASLRRDAVRLLAYAYATSDDWRNLMELLETGGAGAMVDGELEKFQRAASELGRVADAQRIHSLGAGSRA